jgi:hypothetical protein
VTHSAGDLSFASKNQPKTACPQNTKTAHFFN